MASSVQISAMAAAIAVLLAASCSKNGKITASPHVGGKKRACLVLAPSCGGRCDGQADDDVRTRLGNSANGAKEGLYLRDRLF